MRYYSPTASPDGHTVFALGAPPSTGAELARHDASTGLFVPFLEGLSADPRRVLPRRPMGRLRALPRRDAVAEPLGRIRPAAAHLPAREGCAAPMVTRRSPDRLHVPVAGRDMAHPRRQRRRRQAAVVQAGPPRSSPRLVGRRDRLVFGSFPPTPRRTRSRSGSSTSRRGRCPPCRARRDSTPRSGRRTGSAIAALSADDTRLVLYEFATGRWRDLVAGTDSSGSRTSLATAPGSS